MGDFLDIVFMGDKNRLVKLEKILTTHYKTIVSFLILH